MDPMQIVLWVFIGLVYASVGYLTNKMGDWSTVFQPMRLVITALLGGIVGVILGLMGIALEPETVLIYLQMPLFGGLGVLYIIERVVKAILEYRKVPQQFIP